MCCLFQIGSVGIVQLGMEHPRNHQKQGQVTDRPNQGDMLEGKTHRPTEGLEE